MTFQFKHKQTKHSITLHGTNKTPKENTEGSASQNIKTTQKLRD